MTAITRDSYKLYPGPQLVTGDKYTFDINEKGRVLLHLASEWHGLDREFHPYLNELNLSPFIETIFCCWGHPNRFILMFRSGLSVEETFTELLNPLQERYHYSNETIDLSVEMQPWHDANGVIKFGYSITMGYAHEHHKKEFLNTMMMHLSLMRLKRGL